MAQPQVEQVKSKFTQLLASIGRAGLNSLYPNEFEYYSCSLELVDSQGDLVEMLVFPVMPDNITDDSVSIANVKKSAYGVVSTYNTSFVPFPIAISGTFGRKMRVLLGNREINSSAISFKTGAKDAVGSAAAIFNNYVKTGYGVIKILQKIYDRSFELDQYGSSHRLFFYNLALNSNHLVEMKSLNKSMSRANNMMWNYSIQMQTIAPADKIVGNFAKSLRNIATIDVINKGLNSLVGSFTNEYRIRKAKIA